MLWVIQGARKVQLFSLKRFYPTAFFVFGIFELTFNMEYITKYIKYALYLLIGLVANGRGFLSILFFSNIKLHRRKSF